MKRTIVTTTVLGITLASAVSFASPSLGAGAAGTQAPGVAMARAQAVETAQTQADQARSALGLSTDERLVVKDVVTDADGSTHTRYTRTFKGLRVVGGDLVVARDAAGAVRDTRFNASGKVAVASITPAVAKATAMTQSTSLAASQKVTGATAEAGELVAYAAGDAPRLAWQTTTEGLKSDGTPSRAVTYHDAQTGALLGGTEQIAEGAGHGIFNGQVTIGSTLNGSTFEMRDEHGNFTTDMRNSTSGSGTLFTDADDVWGNGTNSDRASAAVDAQFGAEQTFNYFNDVQGRAGIWGDGRGARSRVHYGNSYVNAFWDGTQMTYGDGANNAAPLTELDVAGHEMSHGVTENTANLDYGIPNLGIYKESGGLNEATSDIFGTAVEFHVNSAADPGDYLIGEEINLNGNGTPLRYMDKPSKDGRSLDCYSRTGINVDPHLSSGPLNHWFYLASEGSGAKTVNGVAYNSPTCDGSTVTGAGRTNIEKVWFRTLSTKLTSTSNYAAAREGAIASAVELYGANSTVCQSVAAAFTAISVPAGTANCSGTAATKGKGRNK